MTPRTATSTLFLSTSDVARLVNTQGLAHAIRELVTYLREDFARWPQFDKTPRVAAHSDIGVIELMPAADAQHYAFKYVNGHPANTALGLSTVMAFGGFADVRTGRPLLLSELTLSTALRTAATSVMAAQLLARPDSKTMALIGNGAQSEFQAVAFQAGLGIDEVRLFDIDAAATAKLERNLRGSGLRVVACTSTAEAVRGADIITTITADKTNATIITPDMVAPGVHINAVGGDCPGKTELHRDVLDLGPVFVEYTPQSRIEGEIQHTAADFPSTELWQVLRGERPGRTDAQQITIFDSVGFAIEDFSMLRYLHDKAVSLGLGSMVELVPALDDPKDLFAALAQQHAHVRRVA